MNRRSQRCWLLVALLSACATPALRAAEPAPLPAPPTWWDEARTQVPAAPCPAVATTITPDGDLTRWAERPCLPLGLPFQSGFDPNWHNRGDLSAQLWLGWDRTWLYVAAQVQDDRVNLSGGDRLRGDQVRLFLARGTGRDEPVRSLCLLPPRNGHNGPGQVVDGDSGEALPGAQSVWITDRGYRLEARLPWAGLPGGVPTAGATRAVAIHVFDWDDDKQFKRGLLFPMPLDPPAAQPDLTQPPETVQRPERLAPLVFLADVAEATAARFLPALVPVAAERGCYDSDDNVRVVALTGCTPAEAARVALLATARDAAPVPLTPDQPWNDGAVHGLSWSWRTPPAFKDSLLLVAACGDITAGTRSYARLLSLGAALDTYVNRFRTLREKLLALASAPGSDARRRRYLGSAYLFLEERERSLEYWRAWVSREEITRAEQDLADGETMAAQAVAGVDPLAGRKGSFQRGYVSEIDDTVQPYSVGIPDNWTPQAHFPLVVTLHGYGGGGGPAPIDDGLVWLSPYGRGNGDYKLWCEEDIRTVIAATIEDYGCDPDRVYCTGGSMGGTGSWQLGVTHPDLFAAIGPTMGNTNQRVWENQWGWGLKEPSPVAALRQWLQDGTSAFHYAENLRNLPASVVHGTADEIVPVGHSRTMVQRLRALGYEVEYEEQEGVGHGGFAGGTEQRQRRYLLTKTRDLWPRHVTYRTSWPRYDGAYWVRLERLAEPGQDAYVDAAVDGQTLTVHQFGCQRLAFTLTDKLLDTKRPVKVTINSSTAFEGLLPPDGLLRLGTSLAAWRPVPAPTALEKNAEVGGPVEHAFMQRFLLVIGTSGDRRTTEVNRRMADQFAEKWRRWGRGQRARVKNDYEVTDRDIAESNLICYGGPDSNRFVARVNRSLPIRFEDGAVVAGGELFRGDTVGVKLCYPNPLNPRRYLCLFAGTTWRGAWDINGRFGNWFDWGVYDDRNWFDFCIFDEHSQNPETNLLAGYFDADWKLDRGLLVRGDPGLRAKTAPRRAPDPLGGLPDGQTVWLSEVAPRFVRMEKGVLGYDQSFAGRRITLGQSTFERGLGIHPEAELVYDLDGSFDTFEAWVGIDLEGATSVSPAREQAERVSFELYGDGRCLARSGELRWNSRPRRLVANLRGVRELKLIARCLDFRKWLFGDAAFGLAKLTRLPKRVEASRREPGGAELLSLDGAWAFEDYPVGAGLSNGAADENLDLPDRLAPIPGSLPAALQACGSLPDLYRNDQLTQADPLATREWWLYRRFDVPQSWQGRRLKLKLWGVTQCGDVFLNGQPLGRTLTPLAPVELDCGTAAHYGRRNLLAVRVTSASAEWTGVDGFNPPASDRVVSYPVAFAEDAGGRCLPLGINGGVELRALGAVDLGAPRVLAEPDRATAVGKAARVPARLTIETELTNTTDEPQTATLRAVVSPPNGGDAPLELAQTQPLKPNERKRVTLTADLRDAQLWWPAGWGGQPLYRLALSVQVGDRVSDLEQATFGVRSLVLSGRGVLLNGRPLTFKAVRWRPVDRLLRRSAGATERNLSLARTLGFNTLVVQAGSEHASPDLLARCDALGLLVLGELPLTPDAGRVPHEMLFPAVEAAATELRNHACRLGYVAGVDVEPGEGRLNDCLGRLNHLDPGALVVDPIPSAPGRASWRLTSVDGGSRVGWTAGVAQIVLPAAPGTDLSYLETDKLPDDEVAQPLPLSNWWRFHGGNEADLAAASAWLGAAGEDTSLETRLTLWQAESARRQLADAAGAAGWFVSALGESWPRIGPALVDFGGRLRPAASVVQQALARPCLRLRATQTSGGPGEILGLELSAPGLAASDCPPGCELNLRVYGLDGRIWREQALALPAAPGEGLLARLDWAIDPGTPPGVYVALAELTGGRLEPVSLLLGVRGDARGTSLQAHWLAEAPPALAGVAAVANGGSVIYCGAGFAPADLDPALKSLAAGAGLVLDGPPNWLHLSPFNERLPVRDDAAEPVNGTSPNVTPEVLLPDHPALAGLKTPLPAGPAEPFRDLAPGATVLIRYAAGRPLLVEGANRTLALLAGPAYRRRLAGWEGWSRLLTGMLAYAGRLPYPDTRRLLAAPEDNPFAGLEKLPPTNVVLEVANGPVSVVPGDPSTLELRLRNDGPSLVPQALLTLSGGPAEVSARLSSSLLALRPGETRTVTLTLTAHRRVKRSGVIKLDLSGWGVKPVAVELPVELGW